MFKLETALIYVKNVELMSLFSFPKKSKIAQQTQKLDTKKTTLYINNVKKIESFLFFQKLIFKYRKISKI